MFFIFVTYLLAYLNHTQIRLGKKPSGFPHPDLFQIIYEILPRILFKGIGKQRIIHRHMIGYHGHIQILVIVAPNVGNRFFHSGLILKIIELQIQPFMKSDHPTGQLFHQLFNLRKAVNIIKPGQFLVFLNILTLRSHRFIA